MLGDMREEKKLSHITPLSPTRIRQSNRGDGGVTLSVFSIRLCPRRLRQTVVTPRGFFRELN